MSKIKVGITTSENIPRYESVAPNFLGKCIMSGAQGVDGSRYHIIFLERRSNGDNIVRIIKK